MQLMSNFIALRTINMAYRALCFCTGFSGKESTCQCRKHERCGFDPWVRKIYWRKAWQPTPVFLSGKSHGQRNLAGCSSWGHKRVGHDLTTKQQSIVYICKSQIPNSSHPFLPTLVSIHLFSTSVSVSALQKCKSK